MTRKEFSQLLVDARVEASCGKNELCRKTGFTFLQLQRIEGALNNYNLILVCKYIDALGLCLRIVQGEEIIFVNQYTQLIEVIKTLRKKHFTQRALADKVGVSYVFIANIENNKIRLSIDKFLPIISALDIQITIKPSNYA